MENKKPKYNSLSEWRKAEPKAYDAAYKQKIISEICLIFGWALPKESKVNKPSGYWTKENVLAEAKKYQSKKQWKVSSGGSYHSAKRNGWLEEATTHMDKIISKPLGQVTINNTVIWTKETILAEAKKYREKKDWRRYSRVSYDAARNQNLMIEISLIFGWKFFKPYKKNKKNYWTKENVLAEAKKYQFKKNWKASSNGSYDSAKKNNWLDEATTHMDKRCVKPHGYWTKENVLAEAKKYQFKKRWRASSSGSYDSAKKNGWLEEATTHMDKIISKPSGYWTKENVLAEAKKYQSKKNWKVSSGGSYHSAKRNGWLEEAITHMDKL